MKHLFKKTRFGFSLTLALGAALPAQGAIINVGDALNVAGLSPGQSFQIVFVTQNAIQRDLLDGVDDSLDNSTIGQWDGWVTTQAAGSTIPGMSSLSWEAMISWDDSRDNLPGIATRDHALVSGPVYRTDGALVATGFADMWDGSIANPISFTENGLLYSAGNTEVWTGDASDYLSQGIVGLWPAGDGADAMQTGYLNQTSGSWHTFGAHVRRGPNDARRVYALSEVITIAAIPEPSTALLSGLGGLLLFLRRRR